MIFILLTGKQREKLYLSYVNDFLTVDAFCDHYGTDKDATINFLNSIREA